MGFQDGANVHMGVGRQREKEDRGGDGGHYIHDFSRGGINDDFARRLD
jgi:hypothetical protein